MRMRAMLRPFASRRIRRGFWGAPYPIVNPAGPMSSSGKPLFLSPVTYSGQPYSAGIQCGYVGEEADRLALWELQKKIHRGFHDDWTTTAPTELAVVPEAGDPALEADLAAVEAELASETPVQGIVIGNIFR